MFLSDYSWKVKFLSMNLICTCNIATSCCCTGVMADIPKTKINNPNVKTMVMGYNIPYDIVKFEPHLSYLLRITALKSLRFCWHYAPALPAVRMVYTVDKSFGWSQGCLIICVTEGINVSTND